ncbi:hypothetical protein DID78_05315, partial [Candidatus Marinamargulisbacteria bacterium SCGC AG-343-D04]
MLYANTAKEIDILDSGGHKQSSEHYNLVFQSVAPVFNSVQQSDSYINISGTHFSSKVHDVTGFNEGFESKDVTLNATVSGLIASRVQFQVKTTSNHLIDFSGQDDTSNSGGWATVWDSTVDTDHYKANHYHEVSFRARVFDGLSWSAWDISSKSTLIDNVAPIIQNNNISEPIFSPNNFTSVGIKDESEISFDVTERYFEEWELKMIRDDGFEVRSITSSSSDFPTSITWNGTGDDSSFVEDGVYTVSLDVTDKAGNITHEEKSISVDNSSPVLQSMVFNGVGKDLNSQKGDLQSNWTITDEFKEGLEYSISLSSMSPPVKSIDSLVLWLDAGDDSVLTLSGSNVTHWLDKSNMGNNFVEDESSPPPTIIADAVGGFNAVKLPDITNKLISSINFSQGNIRTYAVVSDNETWKIVSSNITLSEDERLILGDSSFLPYVEFAEILLFNESLSVSQIQTIESYLNYKWQLSNDEPYYVQSTNQSADSWGKSNVDDSTYFQLRVITSDEAGNTLTAYSDTIQTPDRTAPQIKDEFVSISGIEDITWISHLSDKKEDNISPLSLLTWTPELITVAENAIKSSEDALLAANPVNNGLSIQFIPSPNVNTDPFDTEGNLYGKQEAWIHITLEDAEGNTSQKDIQIHIQPVNDAPEFIDIVQSNLVYDSTNSIIYNIKFDEDTAGPTVTLDNFVHDIDNIKADLNWSVSDDDFYLDDSVGGGEQVFRKKDTNTMSVILGDESSNHSMNFQSLANWYGDEDLILSVQDPDALTVSQSITVRVWPVNDAP